jgi:hypothetical protein
MRKLLMTGALTSTKKGMICVGFRCWRVPKCLLFLLSWNLLQDGGEILDLAFQISLSWMWDLTQRVKALIVMMKNFPKLLFPKLLWKSNLQQLYLLLSLEDLLLRPPKGMLKISLSQKTPKLDASSLNILF